MILEGIATTRNPDGSINIAPMGPIVDREIRSLRFRPFPTSQTYANLHRTGMGVFHIVDDVLLLARAALGYDDECAQYELEPAMQVEGSVLVDCCRWFEFRVSRRDESGERPVFEAEILRAGRRRDFWGFNRAKHAVIEAAILATRLHLTGRAAVLEDLEKLRATVEKTGGEQERQAFELVLKTVLHGP